MKSLFKQKIFKVWTIVSSILLVLMITVSTVITQVDFIAGTLDIVFGGPVRKLESGDAASSMIYLSDYDSKEEAYEAGNDLNETINEEGVVLLKNEGNVLPLDSTSYVSVFGKNSVNLVYGGSGSGGGNFEDAATIFESLEAAGFTVNPVLKEFYESSESGSGRPGNPGIDTTQTVMFGFETGETPQSSYTQTVKDSYDTYSDAAIVVISRIGGEGFDLPRTMHDGDGNAIDGAANPNDHYLELDQNEQDLLQAVCEEFDTVIVIINSSTSMELGFLDSTNDNDATINNYDYASGIQAALWIGGPGYSGIMGLGRILNGEVNPSGRLVDTYARDFTADPTWQNFGDNMMEFGNQYYMADTPLFYYFIDYEEGIYVGYRYYETRGFTDGEAWYDDHVVYPLGYGLSYTTFEWDVTDSNPSDGSAITKDTEITIEVKVTNTGDVAGKDVVQLYVTAPYTAGGIEKSHVVLGGFAKTDTIEPGRSDTVSITLTPYTFASYDYTDANDNGFIGYEVEAGNYVLRLSRDAHTTVDTIDFTVDNDITYATDPTTDYSVVNRFDSVSEGMTSILSRTDWNATFPVSPTILERTVDNDFIAQITARVSGAPVADSAPVQQDSILSSDDTTVKIYDLYGLDYDDPLWDTLLDYLTYDQMMDLIIHGAFQTVHIDTISLPKTTCADGPQGFVNFIGDPSINGTVAYATPTVIASTWNVDLAYAMGVSVGNEGVWGNQAGDGVPYTGWYGPAFNIHRSPFSGRNGEYYSEDGFLSGLLAVNVIQGANSKGIITFVKHFVLNDQETRREINGLLTWVDEQTMREIYFKPFEMAVKDGESIGMMSSFNRIGTVWAGGSYPLLTEVLRNEWGFRGAVITDYNLQAYMSITQMLEAGGDLNLAQSKRYNTDYSDPTYATSIRNATHNILYAVANSNAMNGNSADVVWSYGPAPWVNGMWIIDSALFAGILGWGIFAYITAKKRIG